MNTVLLTIRCPRKLKEEAIQKLKNSKYGTLSNFVRLQLYDFVKRGDENE